ncbi:hypothetical protein ABBQ32_003747 [Trebouxia sp. C0010 RCD-2024]
MLLLGWMLGRDREADNVCQRASFQPGFHAGWHTHTMPVHRVLTRICESARLESQGEHLLNNFVGISTSLKLQQLIAQCAELVPGTPSTIKPISTANPVERSGLYCVLPTQSL